MNIQTKDAKRHRVDSPASGMVLNECKVKAILEAKDNKKSEQQQEKVTKAQKSAAAAEERLKKAFETAQKARLKVDLIESQQSQVKEKKLSSKVSVKKKQENTLICYECNLDHNESDQKSQWLACE